MKEDTGTPVTFPQPSCTPAAGLAPHRLLPTSGILPRPRAMQPFLSGTSHGAVILDLKDIEAPGPSGLSVLQCFRACPRGRRKEGRGKGSRAVV